MFGEVKDNIDLKFVWILMGSGTGLTKREQKEEKEEQEEAKISKMGLSESAERSRRSVNSASRLVSKNKKNVLRHKIPNLKGRQDKKRGLTSPARSSDLIARPKSTQESKINFLN